ncbi:MAG: hypothetical protein PHR16_04735 [Methylovulum sp.]|nr:hypothetical protein [Methylovulum sp.]
MCCLIYAMAYWSVRSPHWLVHRTGYYSDAGKGLCVYGHAISQGDFGVPMLAPLPATMQGAAAIFLWPAAQVELVYWYLTIPQGSVANLSG